MEEVVALLYDSRWIDKMPWIYCSCGSRNDFSDVQALKMRRCAGEGSPQFLEAVSIDADVKEGQTRDSDDDISTLLNNQTTQVQSFTTYCQ